MMMGVFGIAPGEIRYSNISDFAFRLWIEIYCHNFNGNHFITNECLAVDLKKKKVTISRGISELALNDLIEIKGGKRHRQIMVKRYAIEVVSETKMMNQAIKYNSESPALKKFYESIDSAR